MIILNGLSLPAPTALSVRIAPKSGACEYNTLGQLVQDGVFQKRTVEIVWTRMSGTSLGLLAQKLNEGDFFTLSYPDPLAGSREMRCRITGQSARVYQYLNGVPTWADVKLTLEER